MKKTKHRIHTESHESWKLVNAYLQSLQSRNFSKATLKSRRGGLDKFILFLAELGVNRFQDVTKNILEHYRDSLFELGLKATSVEVRLRSVRMFFDYLEENGSLFENPARNMPIHWRVQTLPQVLSIEEVRQLLNTPDISTPQGLRNRAILETLYATALRREELISLTVYDVDNERQTLRVLGKGRKERLLPLGKHASFYIRKYLKDARSKFIDSKNSVIDALWINKDHNPYSKAMLNAMVRKIGKLSGITSAVSSHTLRRSCATHMLQNGAHPVMVAELLGHANLRTLSHYLKVTITELKQTHKNCNVGK